MIHLALLLAAILFLGGVALAILTGSLTMFGNGNKGCGCLLGILLVVFVLFVIGYAIL